MPSSLFADSGLALGVERVYPLIAFFYRLALNLIKYVAKNKAYS